MPYKEPVRGPERRLKSMSDEDADLDSIMLLDNLREDTDEISCIKINNVPLELSLLQAIFEALKTTAKIKHLSLTGVSMKDEVGLMFNEAFEANKTLESLNLESNDLTNETIVPLCKILETHPTIREFKCSHQKHGGLGSRGEEALAKALDKNNQLLKISYPFKVPSSRSLADRCQIRNNEILRQKRTKGEDFYNYREEMQKRDKHPQPWVREKGDPKEEDAKLRGSLLETRRSFKKTGNPAQMRAEAKLRAQENAKPIIDDELASKLNAARGKSRSRFSAR